MRAERPVDNWRIIPPPQREAPDGSPWGHADEPTGALGPRRRKPRTDTPRATIGTIPPLPQREASGMPGPRPRALGAPSSTTGTVGTATPTRVIGTDARCRQPAWDISTDARSIPLAVSTAPAQCRQPPRGADHARPCGARSSPPCSKPAHPYQRAPVRGAPPPCEPTGRIPRSGAPPPPGYAHKDPDLRNTRCTQRLDSALVCDPVFPNSLPCVRHRDERAPRPVNPRPRQFQPRPRA